MPDYAFPRELLDQPPEARLGYFKSFTIAHPLLKEADAALKQAIQEPAGWSLIFVYGPTGVGKTTLRRRVEKHLKESMMEVLRQDPGLVPVASMEAAAPDSSQFSWKDYYRRALIALDEPLIDRKLTCQVRSSFRDARDTFGRALTDPRAAGLEIRLALESALIHRRPAAFFIDEAQHLAKMKSGRKLQDQLDSIKSLASLANTVHVLEYCYERSIGCVGLVKDWLTRALALAMNQNANAVNVRILEKTAWSVDQSERMARETVDGESDVSEKEEKRDRLRHLLRLGTTSSATAPAAARVNPPARHVRQRVGERKPVRDLVGVAKEA